MRSQALAVDEEPATDFAEIDLEIALPQSRAVADDMTFRQEVAAAEGVVLIGLKDTAAARTLESGRVASLSRAAFRWALDSIAHRGIAVQQRFRNTPAVVATLSPDEAVALRGLSFVNYVEASKPFRLASESRASLSAVTEILSSSTQDTTWGLHTIHAPRVWQAGYRGQGAFLTMLDDGVDSYHALNPSGDGPANLPAHPGW